MTNGKITVIEEKRYKFRIWLCIFDCG